MRSSEGPYNSRTDTVCMRVCSVCTKFRKKSPTEFGTFTTLAITFSSDLDSIVAVYVER